MKMRRTKGFLGIGLTAGLVFASLAVVFTVPATAGEMEWTTINTPSWENNLILPGSDLRDMTIGESGDVIYVVAQLDDDCRDPEWDDEADCDLDDYALFKSEDGGVTWSDITQNIYEANSLPPLTEDDLTSIYYVAIAPDDEDWVAVVGRSCDGEIWVIASKDGGSNFTFAGEVYDSENDSAMEDVMDIAVSPEVDGIHNIAVAGEANNYPGDGAIFRLKAGTWLTGGWEDTRYYGGWDDVSDSDPNEWFSEVVIAVEFSPNFDIDDTIICMSHDDSISDEEGVPLIQSGIWEDNGGKWNGEAGFPDYVSITSEGDTLYTGNGRRSMGFALPADYDGSDPGARSVYCYVNAYNTTTETVGGYLFRIDNGSVSEAYGPSGDPLLASIDFHGEADTGKMIIGEYVGWENESGPDPGDPLDDYDDDELCCLGVRVWHSVELDPCCPDWELACKYPSGLFMAVVNYTPDGEKVYAITGGSASCIGYSFEWFCPDLELGGAGDETAFSVSLDDGVSFNQTGLIDTDIDRLKDVAVCPNCGVIYLSTFNNDNYEGDYEDECSEDDIDYSIRCMDAWYCGCDSVWRSYDNGDSWERIFHGEWTDESGDQLILRLPCDDTDECCTIYLGIEFTDQMYYSRDCGQCWNQTSATKIEIEDFAVPTENVIHIISNDGEHSMSTQYGRRWTDPVDIGFDGDGESIVSCCNEGLLVASANYPGQVAYSEDEGETWEMTDDLGPDLDTKVACDPTCVGTIYAATEGDGGSEGIFRWVVGESTSWDNLNALEVDYRGIVVARDGTLYAATDELNVDTSKDCSEEDRYSNECSGDYRTFSGVARNLTPCETACCGTEDWDYLICGLSNCGEWGECNAVEDFDEDPQPLKLCGCLSSDTNTVLYAISDEDYDAEDLDQGNLWSYEDCAAKHGPKLMAPADGVVLDCELCAGCGAQAFTLKWERICHACSYDIQIMDEDGNLIYEWVDKDITGNPPSLYVDEEAGLTCGETYTWHVREANTSCECIHSPWSETWSFTVAVGASDGISLLSPDNGAHGVPIKNVGFSWTSVPDADTYSFTLSPNANLTGALVSQDQGTTAFNFSGSLDYSKAYYWQVKAWKGSVLLTTSSVGVFNTIAEPEAPTPPVVVNETPAPVVEIPPAQNITPTWIYAVIGIGAALVVVVIVLIVRTRRP